MSKPTIFISCGQFTPAEKRIGSQVVELVTQNSDFEAFFAEEQQDLNGLQANILGMLGRCAGFIVIIHPRGTITKPDGTSATRASVWIEQEIAIAAYIQHIEQRPIPVVAFIHRSVSREGIRDLLNLNPILFDDESEILLKLSGLLPKFGRDGGARSDLLLRSERLGHEQNHMSRMLYISFDNRSNQRFETFEVEFDMPEGFLRHWSAVRVGEIKSSKPRYRTFRFTEKNRVPLAPRMVTQIYHTKYCVSCALQFDPKGVDLPFSVRAWIQSREYAIEATAEKLIKDAGDDINWTLE